MSSKKYMTYTLIYGGFSRQISHPWGFLGIYIKFQRGSPVKISPYVSPSCCSDSVTSGCFCGCWQQLLPFCQIFFFLCGVWFGRKWTWKINGYILWEWWASKFQGVFPFQSPNKFNGMLNCTSLILMVTSQDTIHGRSMKIAIFRASTFRLKGKILLHGFNHKNQWEICLKSAIF